MQFAAPAIIATERRRTFLSGVFLYWHLLSLDAPTVAVLWAWSFARAASVHPSPAAIAILGLGTWIVYVGDRLLDARPGARRSDLRDRHFFHARNRGVLLAGCAAAAVPLLWLVAARMPEPARREDTAIFAASMAYFVPVHLPVIRIRFPRELVVGILFAAATVVPAWSRSRSPHAELAALALLFAALCWLNCAAIHVWEREGRVARLSLVQPVAFCIVAGAAMVMLLAFSTRPGVAWLAAAGLASALMLLALDRLQAREGRFRPSRLALRIAADAVLLTPLFFLIPWRG